MNSVSLRNKSWVLNEFNNEDVLFYKDNFSLDEITSKLLSIRKIKKEDIIGFLNPTIKNYLPNPDTLNDMQKSAHRSFKSIKNLDKIGIFGDYDVDGASSTALLGNFFSINLDYEIYIPDRKAKVLVLQ